MDNLTELHNKFMVDFSESRLLFKDLYSNLDEIDKNLDEVIFNYKNNSNILTNQTPILNKIILSKNLQ
jgi:hypothetical protein